MQRTFKLSKFFKYLLALIVFRPKQKGYESLHATTVTKANLVTAVSALAGLSTPRDDATLLLKDSRQRAQVDELPLTPLFGASNTVLWRGDAYRFTSNRCAPRSAGYQVVSRADLAIAAISGGHQTSVLVTKLSDNSPVAGATVTFYQYDDRRTSVIFFTCLLYTSPSPRD